MPNRRQFLRYSAAATVAATLPGKAFGASADPLASRNIAATGEALPVIGLGNSRAFRDADLATAGNLIDIFLDHGGRYIDASGSSRFIVGRIAQQKAASERLFIGNYIDPRASAAMRQEIRQVAQAQGKPALDLVHTRDIDGYRRRHANYQQLKDDGLVRYIGVARSGERTFEAIGNLVDAGQVDFIQVNYSLLEPDAAERLLPLAKDKGVAVCINRPFINGRYFSVVRGQPLPDWAAEFDCHSWAQFSLKFILGNPAVNCVLTETANPGHAQENLAAGTGRLPDAQTQRRMLEVIRRLV